MMCSHVFLKIFHYVYSWAPYRSVQTRGFFLTTLVSLRVKEKIVIFRGQAAALGTAKRRRGQGGQCPAGATLYSGSFLLHDSGPIDGLHLTSWRPRWRYNTKEYVISSIVGSSRRGWLILSVTSREIYCKPRILRNFQYCTLDWRNVKTFKQCQFIK